MIGSTLNHYRVLEAAGKGGMAMVYVAEDTRLKRRVALKVLPEEAAADALSLERFHREAEAIASLNHPNIVTIYSVEQCGDVHFMTMELIEGRTLAQLIPPGGLGPKRFLDLAIPLAQALAAAHAAQINHRDLKPANVMVTGKGIVKILDFGLAKLLSPSAGSSGADRSTLAVTAPGTVLGTVQYMSPEQIKGEAVDQRSDVFSLGVVLYEMACGQTPFSGRSVAEVMSAVVGGEARPMAELRPGLPRRLRRLIEGCLATQPRDRLTPAEDLGLELEELRRELSNRPTGDGRRPSGRERPAAEPLSAVSRLRPPELRLPEIPSIAVLPFDNLGGRQEDEFLSSGITVDLISALTKLRDLLVIAQNSVLVYKNRPVDVREVGRILGVGCVLQGSVERVNDRLRVHVQLIDARSGAHVWAERYDRQLDDVFQVQDEITSQVVTELDVRLLEGEQARVWHRSTPSLPAYENYIEGVTQLFQMTPEGTSRAAGLLTQSLKIDPDFAQAWAMLGICHSLDFRYGWNKPLDRSMVRMLEASSRARELDEMLPMAHTLLGHVALACSEQDEAVEHSQRAVELSPGSSLHRASLGNCCVYAGDGASALSQVEKAVRLSPFYPAWYELIIGDAYSLLGRPDDAIAAYQAHIERTPEFPLVRIRLIATLAANGRRDRARHESHGLLEVRPDFNLRDFADGWGPRAIPYKDPKRFQQIVRGLESAGLAS